MVEGDPVVALSWLHNGVKLALHVEKVCPSSAGDAVREAGSGLGNLCSCCSGLPPWPWASGQGEFFQSKRAVRSQVPVGFQWGLDASFLLAL